MSPKLIIAVTIIINTTASSTTSGRSTAPLYAFSILSLVEGQCHNAHEQALPDFHSPFQLSIEHLLVSRIPNTVVPMS